MDIVLDGRPEGIDPAAKINTKYDVPRTLFTGKKDEATLRRAAQVEPTVYLLAPSTAADLRAAIEVALRQDRAQREYQADARPASAETIAAILGGSRASRPATVPVRPAASRDSEPGSDPPRGFELHTYSRDAETLWTSDRIQAAQSPSNGSVRLRGGLGELLARIKD